MPNKYIEIVLAIPFTRTQSETAVRPARDYVRRLGTRQ